MILERQVFQQVLKDQSGRFLQQFPGCLTLQSLQQDQCLQVDLEVLADRQFRALRIVRQLL